MPGRSYWDAIDVDQNIRFRQVPYDPTRQPVRLSTQGAVSLTPGTTPLLVDGIAVALGDRILVRLQGDPTLNGLFEVLDPGTGADGTWARTTDFAAGQTPVSKVFVAVQEGTDAGNFYYLDTTATVTVGVSALPWALLNGGGGGGVSLEEAGVPVVGSPFTTLNLFNMDADGSGSPTAVVVGGYEPPAVFHVLGAGAPVLPGIRQYDTIAAALTAAVALAGTPDVILRLSEAVATHTWGGAEDAALLACSVAGQSVSFTSDGGSGAISFTPGSVLLTDAALRFQNMQLSIPVPAPAGISIGAATLSFNEVTFFGGQITVVYPPTVPPPATTPSNIFIGQSWFLDVNWVNGIVAPGVNAPVSLGFQKTVINYNAFLPGPVGASAFWDNTLVGACAAAITYSQCSIRYLAPGIGADTLFLDGVPDAGGTVDVVFSNTALEFQGAGALVPTVSDGFISVRWFDSQVGVIQNTGSATTFLFGDTGPAAPLQQVNGLLVFNPGATAPTSVLYPADAPAGTEAYDARHGMLVVDQGTGQWRAANQTVYFQLDTGALAPAAPTVVSVPLIWDGSVSALLDVSGGVFRTYQIKGTIIQSSPTAPASRVDKFEATIRSDGTTTTFPVGPTITPIQNDGAAGEFALPTITLLAAGGFGVDITQNSAGGGGPGWPITSIMAKIDITDVLALTDL